MLTFSLGILKYALMVVGAGLGIHGVMHDYKRDGRLTREGRLAVVAMIVVASLTVVAAGLEQYASHVDNLNKLRRERLGHPLSDLSISWNIPYNVLQVFEQEVTDLDKLPARPASGSWLLYIGTAARGGELAVTRGITGWRLDMSLQRPQGGLTRNFVEGSLEWIAFERAIQRVIGDRFDLSLANGRSILDLAGGAWPMELVIERSTITFHVITPAVSPLELQDSAIRFTHRGEFRPQAVRISTTDPRVTIDETLPLRWNRKAWRTVMNEEAETEPLYQFQSTPVEVRLKVIDRD